VLNEIYLNGFAVHLPQYIWVMTRQKVICLLQ